MDRLRGHVCIFERFDLKTRSEKELKRWRIR
jgi:hypothetical protein